MVRLELLSVRPLIRIAILRIYQGFFDLIDDYCQKFLNKLSYRIEVDNWFTIFDRCLSAISEEKKIAEKL